MSSTPASASSSSSISPPPSKMPPPTGNWFVDAYQSVAHIGDMPCARNSLLSGIGGGFGIGVVRGLSASAFVAGNWACAAFIVISLGSFQICQSQMARERQTVTRVIETMPRRVVKQAEDDPSTSSASPPS